ncbi:hypothetical protein EJ903_02170 [Azospirillum griseum]|uniref:Uncharacterized protein n=1 Tax=Azospirillum griseum TaxID=2496639 RepID=A0A3S0KES6_9PROT|nr:hypothetical protein EJ903_02170 [Azospirillum griseum]
MFTDDHGAENRPCPWHPPAVITDEMKRDAVHALGVLKVQSRPVNQEEADRFVAHVANLCAGKDLPPERKLMGAASAILRAGYPAAIINDADVVKRVLRRLTVPGRPTWWPSWPELEAALDAERAAFRQEWERLTVIAKGGAGPRIGRWRDTDGSDHNATPTEAQKANVAKLLADAGIIKRMPGVR